MLAEACGLRAPARNHRDRNSCEVKDHRCCGSEQQSIQAPKTACAALYH